MNQKTEKLAKWFFELVGYFNHNSFFTKKLWQKVAGFENHDEAEIKCAFMHYWFNEAFGYYTCPCGSAWFVETSKEGFKSYIAEYKPVFDAYIEHNQR